MAQPFATFEVTELSDFYLAEVLPARLPRQFAAFYDLGSAKSWVQKHLVIDPECDVSPCFGVVYFPDELEGGLRSVWECELTTPAILEFERELKALFADREDLGDE